MHWFWRATIAAILGYVFQIAIWALMVYRMYGMPFNTYMQNAVLKPTSLVSMLLTATPIAFYALLTKQFGPQDERPSETRCRKCGYILRGISEPRCPEYGERI